MRRSLLVLLVLSCDVPPEEVPAPPLTEAQMAAIPQIDFTTKPSYLANNVISLTFDDGPDLTNTPKVLDTLKEKGVKATFFICTHNIVNVDTSQAAKDIVKRIVAEGHELASHTVAHLHLPQQTPEKVESELAGVEKTVADIFGPTGPKMTLFRAPYGEPYTSPGSAGFNKVAPIGAKHGVHIGWAIDTLDWEKPNADAVYSSFTGLVKTPGNGAYGVVLMHSIHPQTAGALPRIIDYIKANKFELKQVEDVVRARYGKTSGEIFGVSMPGTGGSGGATGGATGSDAGAGTGGGGGGGSTGEDAGAGGNPGTGGGGPGTGGSTGGTATGGNSGTGGKTTGGNTGTGGKATGTGGDGEEETGGSSGGTYKGGSGGCTYGGRSPAAFWVVTLGCAALVLSRRRRRS